MLNYADFAVTDKSFVRFLFFFFAFKLRFYPVYDYLIAIYFRWCVSSIRNPMWPIDTGNLPSRRTVVFLDSLRLIGNFVERT